MPEPRVFSIPTGAPFLPTLADALLDGTLTNGWPDGAELADATIYLPTRRAGRALALLLADRCGARATLLPRIVPLGDAEGDPFEPDGRHPAPPPLSTLERRLILARLVQTWMARIDRIDAPFAMSPTDSPADAVSLAGDLAALMDGLVTEGVPWKALAEAVEAEFSRYFALTLEFVRIAHESWPGILAERGASDPAKRRHEALVAEAGRLAADPPRGPVVAAGSTGSVPATARLLAAIARLPHGAVVLPGLDTGLDAAAWAEVGGTARTVGATLRPAEPLWGHPQTMMLRLLRDSIGLDRSGVRELGPTLHAHHPVAARRRLLSEVMRPAETTDAWAAIPPLERDMIAAAGREGLALAEAADEREEALVIAIALREALEEPGATAALVTPDRGLAQRVATELARWDVVVDDSAGLPLADTPAGRLARLAAEAAAAEFGPVPLLALLAHPAVTLGVERAEVDRAASALEIGALRGPPPAAGLDGVRRALLHRRAKRGARDPLPRQNLSDVEWDAAADLVTRLERAFAGFRAADHGGEQSLPALAGRLADVLASLTTVPACVARAPARDEAMLLALLDELAQAPKEAAILGRFGDLPAFLAALCRDSSVPPEPAGGHRRVRILGLLEARLLHVDRMVLGGLDEGIWPPAAENDAFLNRPMRVTLGLSPAERRIGQTAHDFVQALGTRDVLLTRARKRDGKPTVPSRFLERLRSFVGTAGWAALKEDGARFRAFAAALDAPRPTAPLRPPAPRPGPARFPRALSVTEIETLVRDPYAIFARHILRLTPLDPVGLAPSAAERGTILHAILAGFAGAHPGALPPGAERDLIQRGADAFRPIADAYPELHALWWPDFLRMVPHVLDWEAARRSAFPERHLERFGVLAIPLPGGALTVRGVADRIDIGPDGAAAIVDYKSGRAPTNREVAVGFSPQLTLEAAMLMEGGFRDVPASPSVPDLHYIKLGGSRRLVDQPLEALKDGKSLAATVEAHVAGLARLAARFVEEDAPYLARPFPQYARRHSSYDHLARVKEWTAASGPDEAEAG